MLFRSQGHGDLQVGACVPRDERDVGLKGKVPFAATCRQTQSQIQIKMTVQFNKMPRRAVGAYARQMQIGIAANPQVQADQMGNITAISRVKLRHTVDAGGLFF